MSETDYKAFADVAAVSVTGEFAVLDGLLRQAQEAEAKAEQLAAELKRTQELLRDLTWRRIPEQMETMGLEEFKHKSGLKVTVKEEIEASITEANRNEAFSWLDDNGHSGLLKRNVTVAFSKNEQEAAEALADELQGKFPAVSTDMKVHPSSLKAWVKEMLSNGEPFPLEKFGVFRRRVAKFTLPPRKK